MGERKWKAQIRFSSWRSWHGWESVKWKLQLDYSIEEEAKIMKCRMGTTEHVQKLCFCNCRKSSFRCLHLYPQWLSVGSIFRIFILWMLFYLFDLRIRCVWSDNQKFSFQFPCVWLWTCKQNHEKQTEISSYTKARKYVQKHSTDFWVNSQWLPWPKTQ